ncbi:MAG: hypothetical protein LBT88_02335 [Oscillospiraceae bacterium]|jgi:hypothetical protein|nr:hypothetical protein [Oscillospiraceae bacterium]
MKLTKNKVSVTSEDSYFGQRSHNANDMAMGAGSVGTEKAKPVKIEGNDLRTRNGGGSGHRPNK